MTLVNILQTDNRPVTGYIALTQNVNKKISEETKLKMSISAKKRWAK